MTGGNDTVSYVIRQNEKLKNNISLWKQTEQSFTING